MTERVRKHLKNQNGIVHVLPLLLIVAAVGVLSFLLISDTAGFKDGLFSNLFPKRTSNAAASDPVSDPIILPTPSPTPNSTSTPRPSVSPTPMASFRPTPTPIPTPTAPPATNGLMGSYFNNQTFSGNPTVRRDLTVDFNWGTGSPLSGISTERFSIRWTGVVRTTTAGVYKFCTTTDDGSRLWVNNVQLVNKWTNHSTIQTCGTTTLAANTNYPLVMEYYENTAQAIAQLEWGPPGKTVTIIPATNLFDQ